LSSIDQGSGNDLETRQALLLRTILSGATLVMVALSWPLWIDLDDFPAVPFVPGLPEYPRAWSWLGLGLVAVGLVLGMSPRWNRAGLALAILVFSWLILGDQLRFQPWVYQFLILGALLVLLPPRWALRFGRLWMASIYFHSGLSKLDASFARDTGPLFVRTLTRVLATGAPPAAWIDAAAIVMPVAEITVAVSLLIRRTRRLGYVGLLLIHTALLLILGPWGLRHTTIVLVWNVALAAEEFVLYWPRPSDESPRRWGAREKIAAVPLAVLLILPFGERAGLFDSWPSHALYAAHCEATTIYFRRGLPAALPADLRIAARRGADGWVLNLTDWTRRARGVPSYPQVRYGNGLAEWIAERIEGESSSGLYVDHRLRADPWAGRANSLTVRDLKEARELSKQFWFNAHPRRRPGG
jgi:hypothetical protein